MITNIVVGTGVTAAGLSDAQLREAKLHELRKAVDADNIEYRTLGADRGVQVSALTTIVTEQEIQTKALKQLVTHENYYKMSDEEKRKEFNKIIGSVTHDKAPVEEKANKLHNALNRGRSIARDAWRSIGPQNNDPYHINNIQKLEIAQDNALTKNIQHELAIREEAANIGNSTNSQQKTPSDQKQKYSVDADDIKNIKTPMKQEDKDSVEKLKQDIKKLKIPKGGKKEISL